MESKYKENVKNEIACENFIINEFDLEESDYCECTCGTITPEYEQNAIDKHSRDDEKNNCLECTSNKTANLTMKEMAELLMEYLPCHKDNDIIYTLENQFKERDDLEFMLMAVSKNKYKMTI